MPEEQTQSTTKPPESLEVIKYREEVAQKVGLPSPYGMSVLKSMCEDMVASGMVPQCFGKNPLAVYAAAMRGREMGLSPSESIFETFWSAPGGRLGIYAGKMLQLMHKGGVQTDFVATTAEECTIEFTPLAPHKPITVTFRIQEAIIAGLVKPDSNWKKWPSDMCRARCIARGWRMLLGAFEGSANLYSKEELDDIPVDRTAEVALEKKEERETLSQFNPGRRGPGRPRKEPVTEPIPEPVSFSPRDALAIVMGARTPEEFAIYSASTGLDKLEGREYDCFCLLAAKVVDTKTIIKLHEVYGVAYSAIYDLTQEKLAGKFEETKRSIAEQTVEELLNHWRLKNGH